MRVNSAIEDGSSLREPRARRGVPTRARERGADVHLLGLVSHGGVHSHIEHLRALLELARREGIDGGGRRSMRSRTVATSRRRAPSTISPSSPPTASRRCPVATTRWTATSAEDRTALAAGAILDGAGQEEASAAAAVRESHERGVTDEFIEPVVMSGRPRLRPVVDSAVFFNVQTDHRRQLSQRLVESRRRPDDDDGATPSGARRPCRV